MAQKFLNRILTSALDFSLCVRGYRRSIEGLLQKGVVAHEGHAP